MIPSSGSGSLLSSLARWEVMDSLMGVDVIFRTFILRHLFSTYFIKSNMDGGMMLDPS